MTGKRRLLTDIRIERLGYGGVGISKLPNGKTLMIKGGLPGSVVDCLIVKQKKDYIEAHIVAVKEMDSTLATQVPRCPHYHFHYQHQHQLSDQDSALENGMVSAMPEHKRGCGGCKRQVVSYDQQLQLKYDIVQDCFRKLSQKMGGVEILPVIASPRQFGYRNKIEFSFGKYLRKGDAETGREVDEQWLLGFHKQGMYTKVVDVDQCYLIDDAMHQVYVFLKQSLLDSGLPVYDNKQHAGFLRHMVVRSGVHTGHIMVILSVATSHLIDHPEDARRRDMLQQTWQQHEWLQSHVTTLLINDNNGLADVVKPQDVVLSPLWGPGYIYEELRFGMDEADEGVMATVRFRVSPFSFFQTNTLGAQELFGKAVKMMGHVTGNIIDLYCGSGSIGLTCLALGKGLRLKGIEIVDDAVKDAYYNAKINGLEEKAQFYSGKAEDLLKTGVIDEEFFVGGDVVVVDPPREGLHKHVVDFLIHLHKQFGYKLVYISCNPVTMARDIGLLMEGGFRCGVLQPVDMFPHTHHIEIITVLQ